MGLVSLAFAGSCGVDPRWGEPAPTNPSLPGSPGVDARWGGPRTDLRDPMAWQYEDLPAEGMRAQK